MSTWTNKWKRIGATSMLLALLAPSASAESLHYTATITDCSSSCDTVGGIGTNGDSTVAINILLPSGGPGVHTLEQGAADFEAFFNDPSSPSYPTFVGSSPTCYPTTAMEAVCSAHRANPLKVNERIAEVVGTVTIASDGTLSGIVTLQFIADPFALNAASFTIDLSSGESAFSLLDGAFILATFAGEATVDDDYDADGVSDSVDNCTLLPNDTQTDTDNDGYGNRCDADLNNDCTVNITDMGILRMLFHQVGNIADLSGDNIVSVIDLGIMRTLFFKPPGPSASANAMCTTF